VFLAEDIGCSLLGYNVELLCDSGVFNEGLKTPNWEALKKLRDV
jgi:hypothetical protein